MDNINVRYTKWLYYLISLGLLGLLIAWGFACPQLGAFTIVFVVIVFFWLSISFSEDVHSQANRLRNCLLAQDKDLQAAEVVAEAASARLHEVAIELRLLEHLAQKGGKENTLAKEIERLVQSARVAEFTWQIKLAFAEERVNAAANRLLEALKEIKQFEGSIPTCAHFAEHSYWKSHALAARGK